MQAPHAMAALAEGGTLVDKQQVERHHCNKILRAMKAGGGTPSL